MGWVDMTQRFEIGTEEFNIFVTNLRERLENIPLDATQRAEANADLSTVEAQAQSPAPKSDVIRACMVSLQTILSNAADAPFAIATVSLASY